MPPAQPATPAPPRSRAASKAGSQTAAPTTAPRITRLRAAKENNPAVGLGLKATPSGLLARGREGLRLVSDKIKDKEKERPAVKPLLPGDNGIYSESLQAFLRIRPPPQDADPNRSRPYLEPQGDKEVLMRAPIDPSRPHVPKPPHIFSFDRIFPPSTSQSAFFTTTTLPLVEKLLHGENGLLFAYGVSNSGKSYTISGGSAQAPQERGLLPRAIDVVFNSIAGHESKANLRCKGLADVDIIDEKEEDIGILDRAAYDATGDELIKIDRNFSYAVFVSYAEVYNEKIFDLLDSVLPNSTVTPTPSRPHLPTTGQTRSSAAYPVSRAYGSAINLAALANGGAGVLKRRALALKNDPEGNGKFIADLKEVRVRSREEALAVVRSGERARQVFGTLSNRESSRSHGIFTIKIVRIHNGAPEDPDSAQVSRLAIVDLAGSERTRNTGTTGERLKEAGNINKSLMVLGQCLEVLRSNQQKMASPAPAGSRKKLAIVPFRHSKLTEVFQSFFVGDGRAVMIVNVNPYDTGYDENAHVMRFSAVAREIQTTAHNKVTFPGLGIKRQISSQFNALKHAVSGPMKVKVIVPVLAKVDEALDTTRFAMDRESQGFIMVEEELEVVEEDDEESEDERDWFVEYLLERLKESNTKLYESEMRNASIEVEVREEVARELEETTRQMHLDFTKRLQDQLVASDLKVDRKLDILSRTMTPAVSRVVITAPDTSSPLVVNSRSHRDPTGETEMTADDSFESAVDTSLISEDSLPTTGRMTDPFLVGSGLPRTAHSSVIVASAVGVSSAIVGHTASRTAEDQSTSSQGLFKTALHIVDRKIREATTDSDDILAASAIDDMVDEPSESASESAESDSDAAEEQETDCDDEDIDFDENAEQDADADEEEVIESESESEFDGSDSMSELSSDDSRVRRATARRRTTGSPVKPRSPVKKTVAANGTVPKPDVPVGSAGGRKGRKTLTVKGSLPENAASLAVLGERTGQDDEEEQQEEVPVKPKKKRTLGKKIIMEEEIERADVRGRSVAEARRVLR